MRVEMQSTNARYSPTAAASALCMCDRRGAWVIADIAVARIPRSPLSRTQGPLWPPLNKRTFMYAKPSDHIIRPSRFGLRTRESGLPTKGLAQRNFLSVFASAAAGSTCTTSDELVRVPRPEHPKALMNWRERPRWSLSCEANRREHAAGGHRCQARAPLRFEAGRTRTQRGRVPQEPGQTNDETRKPSSAKGDDR